MRVAALVVAAGIIAGLVVLAVLRPAAVPAAGSFTAGMAAPASSAPASPTPGSSVPGVSAPGAPAARQAPPPASPPPPATVDIKALVHEAQRVQRADALAWSRFRFHRTIRAGRLDATGAVLQESVLEFEIMPLLTGGFDERLLRIDGRDPSPEEITRYREDASFSRHYTTLTTTNEEGDEADGYSLATLLRLSEYKYIGVDTIEGLPAHRLDFEPDPVPHGTGVAARVTQAMAGTLWLTVEGAHLVRARAATIRPVSLYLGLGKVHSLDIGIDVAPAGPMAPDVFLPRQLTINTNLRVFFSNQHRRRIFAYGGYAPVSASGAAPRTTSGCVGAGCPPGVAVIESGRDEPAPEAGPGVDLRRDPAAGGGGRAPAPVRRAARR